MSATWWANFTAAGVVLIPLMVTLINAIRARHDVLEVKQLVNGHSSRMDDRLAELQAELAAAKELLGNRRVTKPAGTQDATGPER